MKKILLIFVLLSSFVKAQQFSIIPPFSGWGLNGNIITSSNYIGSNNAQDFIFKTSNIERFKITSSGYKLFTTLGVPVSGEPVEFTWTVNGSDVIAGNNYGIRSSFHYSNTANNSAHRLGALLGVAYCDAANTSTLGWLVASYGSSEHLGQGLILRNVGGYFIGSNRSIGTGSVANNYSGYFQTECLSGYTIDNISAFVPTPLTSTAGTIYNNKGLYISTQAGIGINSNYSIYQQGASDLSYFEGSITSNSNIIVNGRITTPSITVPYFLGSSVLSGSVTMIASNHPSSTGTGIAFQLNGGNNGTVTAFSTLHNGNILWPNARSFNVIDGAGSQRTLFTYSAGDNLTFIGRPGVTGIFFANGSRGTAMSIRENNKVIINGTAPTAFLHVVGDFLATTTGTITGGLSVSASGGAALVGNATLVGGTITVNTTKAVTGCYIVLTRKTSGGTIGTAVTYTITNGVSFTITSDNVLDTSTFTWFIINP